MMRSILQKHIIVMTLLCILVVVSVIGLLWVARVVHQKIESTQQSGIELATYERNRSNFGAQAAALKDLQARITTLSTAVVTNAQIPAFLSELESLAEKDGVQFKITSVDTVTDSAKHSQLSIMVTAQAPLSTLQSFLEELKGQRYVVSFTHFDLSAMPSTPDQMNMGQVKKATTPQWQLITTILITSFTQ